jgi:phospholipase C
VIGVVPDILKSSIGFQLIAPLCGAAHWIGARQSGRWRMRIKIVLSAAIVASFVSTGPFAAPLQPGDTQTVTPIKHVIVIIGENRSFDHIFAAYTPQSGQSVLNLLSQGIIKEDGTPGPNFSKAAQYRAQVYSTYESAPSHKEPYATLPPVLTGTAPQTAGDKGLPFQSASAATLDEGILASDQHLLLSGATGLPLNSIDTRLPNATMLPNGPYQLTPGIPYDAWTADPVHRFFQMWQQLDCAVQQATAENPQRLPQ